jgi:hypothetical protein
MTGAWIVAAAAAVLTILFALRVCYMAGYDAGWTDAGEEKWEEEQ